MRLWFFMLVFWSNTECLCEYLTQCRMWFLFFIIYAILVTCYSFKSKIGIETCVGYNIENISYHIQYFDSYNKYYINLLILQQIEYENQ